MMEVYTNSVLNDNEKVLNLQKHHCLHCIIFPALSSFSVSLHCIVGE